MVMGEIDELVDFLKPGATFHVRSKALEIVEGLTGTTAGITALRPVSGRLAQHLLLCVPNPDLSRAAVTCLVNLSQDDAHCHALIDAKACSRLVEFVTEGKTTEHDVTMMTLSNLTRCESGISQLLQLGEGPLEYSGARRLLNIALKKDVSNVMYEHVAGVLCNITQNRQGRSLLAGGNLHGFRALVEMLTSPKSSDVKRTGAAAAVKNMVLASKDDGWFDDLVKSPELLERLLVPINGLPPEEKEASVRENVSLSIALIAKDDTGRSALFDVGAHDTVKKGYEYEEHPGTIEAMEQIGRLFLGVSEPSDDTDGVDSVVMLG